MSRFSENQVMDAEPRPFDFEVERRGSECFIFPQNDAATGWLYEHLYDLVTWFGGAVILESRYLASLIEDIIEADFTFSFDEI
jgi:hypothetical protein